MRTYLSVMKFLTAEKFLWSGMNQITGKHKTILLAFPSQDNAPIQMKPSPLSHYHIIHSFTLDIKTDYLHQAKFYKIQHNIHHQDTSQVFHCYLC